MRTLRLLLGLSLVLNLFLAGALVGGAAWLHRRGGGMIAAGALRVAGDELPDARRAAFRQALRDIRLGLRPTIRDSRAARAAAAGLLRAPQVDQPAVLAALARARTDDVAVRAAVEERAVAFAATLSPAERARLADAIERRARPRGR